MRYLITGGAGYIGSVLTKRLLDKDHQVRIVDRFFFGKQHLEDHPNLELICGDIRQPESKWFTQVDGISHLAGLSNDPTAEYNPIANHEMNTVATQAIAVAAKTHGIKRFVFGSSASVYDGIGPGIYDESATLNPRGHYSISKWEAEKILISMVDNDFSPTIYRQGTVYGSSPRMRFDLVVNTFLKDAIIEGQLHLHGGGWQWRPLVDVNDVAMAHELALTTDFGLNGGLFNLAEGNYQIRQLAMLVSGSLNLEGYNVKLLDAPAPALARDYKMSTDKFRRFAGITPTITVLDSVHQMVQEFTSFHVNSLTDPRCYNIKWMSLLEEIHEQHRSFPSIY